MTALTMGRRRTSSRWKSVSRRSHLARTHRRVVRATPLLCSRDDRLISDDKAIALGTHVTSC